jgi:hypothetical protein
MATELEKLAQELIDMMKLGFEGRNLPHSTVICQLERARALGHEEAAKKADECAKYWESDANGTGSNELKRRANAYKEVAASVAAAIRALSKEG